MIDKLKSRALISLEQLILLFPKRNKYSPVFISGCPRSGSTISYQYLVNEFEWSYFSNYEKLNYRSPIMTSAIYCGASKYKASSDSNYGKINGLSSPSDGWSIFHRWFPYYYGDAPVGDLSGLRKTIGWVESIYDLPFIVKNNASSLRIKSLSRVFPEALFIHIDRGFYCNVNSLVNGLVTNKIPLGKTWGTGPSLLAPEYSFKDNLEKSVFQYEFVNTYLDKVISECKVNLVRVSYESIVESDGESLRSELMKEYPDLLRARANSGAIHFRKTEREISAKFCKKADSYRSEMRQLSVELLDRIPFD